ncbi:MAG: hypothetical protein JKY48_08040 [Flavobacteriales bacterium]|nr:hypothetical protein [Flavobacteriales bacterium]
MKIDQRIFPVYTELTKEPITFCEVINANAFEYPFFNDGVVKTRKETSFKKKYKLREISIPNESELLELKGFIFHTSHCGSTLLSRMLNKSSEIRVVSETEAINGLLLAYLLNGLTEKEILNQLNSIINAYRQPIGEEKYLIFKLTSWNVFMANLFQKLYPSIKWIYIDRKTEEVVKSLHKSDGGMEGWFNHPVDVLRRHFLNKDFNGTSKKEYLFDLVEQHRIHANKFKNDNLCLITYPNFLDQFSTIILPHFNLKYSEQEIEEMKHTMAFNSKLYKKEPYIQA